MPATKLTGGQHGLLGEVCGTQFYISRPRFECWNHTELTPDVVPGRHHSY